VAAVTVFGFSSSGVPNAQALNVAEADVTLIIEQYLSVNIQGDIVMTTVVPSWFYSGPHNTSGSSPVDVICNVPAYLWAPTEITLTQLGIGSYAVIADIVFFGVSQAELIGGQWRLTYDPGDHTGLTGLLIHINQAWTVADVAGTYTGTITLTLTPIVP